MKSSNRRIYSRSCRSSQGLFISFRDQACQLAFYYPEGLRSLLFEADYQRHALHPGTLSFRRETKKMSVEGYLRIVHAGVPFAWNYVNFKPTRGGAHLEGFGAALRDVVPHSTHGCRELKFVTNPDTGAHIKVPHSFIGALHLRTSQPRFAGPTKDILMGDDVREFVYKAASTTLRQQWDRLESARRKDIQDFYRKWEASGGERVEEDDEVASLRDALVGGGHELTRNPSCVEPQHSELLYAAD